MRTSPTLPTSSFSLDFSCLKGAEFSRGTRIKNLIILVAQCIKDFFLNLFSVQSTKKPTSRLPENHTVTLPPPILCDKSDIEETLSSSLFYDDSDVEEPSIPVGIPIEADPLPTAPSWRSNAATVTQYVCKCFSRCCPSKPPPKIPEVPPCPFTTPPTPPLEVVAESSSSDGGLTSSSDSSDNDSIDKPFSTIPSAAPYDPKYLAGKEKLLVKIEDNGALSGSKKLVSKWGFLKMATITPKVIPHKERLDKLFPEVLRFLKTMQDAKVQCHLSVVEPPKQDLIAVIELPDTPENRNLVLQNLETLTQCKKPKLVTTPNGMLEIRIDVFAE